MGTAICNMAIITSTGSTTAAALCNDVLLECDVMEVDAASGSTTAATLCSDALQACFSHLGSDAYALVRMALVCRSWREAVVEGDALWGNVVRERWKLLAMKNGRYKYGERSWREVFRVFLRRNRLPLCPSIGQHEAVYASGR